MTDSRYAAFISYSHKDEAVAAWLHGRLERYAIPRGAAPDYGRAGLFGRRIGRVFRDREELPAGYPLSEKINEALAESDALIVLCSPHAARSEYVQKEILEYQRLGKGGRVFPVLVSGEDHEIFPSALSEAREILEADLRPGKDGRDHVVIKLLAGLMGIEPYDLTRREARAQRRRLALAGTGMAGFAALALAAGWFAYQAESRRAALVASNRDLADSNKRLERAFADLRASSLRLETANNSLTQRTRELSDALVQVGLERDNSRKAQALAETRRREAETALAQATRARNEALAANNRARTTLHRFFLTNGERALADGKPFLAVRYALAGQQLSPENRPEYETLLAEAYELVGPHRLFEDGHNIRAVAFSPDGRRFAAIGQDGTLNRWDAESGEGIGAPIKAQSTIQAMAFSPDGHRIATGSFDGTLSLWNADTGHPIGAPVTGHKGDIKTIAFLSGGGRIVTGGGDGTLRLWDSDTGQPVGMPLTGHKGWILAMAVSPDGHRIVTGGVDGDLRQWDADTGGQIGAPLVQHVAVYASPSLPMDAASFPAAMMGPCGYGLPIPAGRSARRLQAHRNGFRPLRSHPTDIASCPATGTAPCAFGTLTPAGRSACR